MTFPHLIARYELQEELGRGGMATVYRAFDPQFERDVAIKVLPREFLHDPMFRARFEREAKTIARLEHYAIVPVYDFGEHQGQPYLVMRYMPGGSLTDRIRRGPLSLADAAAIVTPIAAALDAAHDAGVIHRDVKPANILFGRSGQAHLTDFGIVKLTEATAQLTGSGMVGTPAYMAPEMARPGGVGPPVDVYALGVTLYQMLAGGLPYEADTPMGAALAHITTPIPDIREVRPDLPDDVQVVTERAMAKDPAARFQRAGELADALRALAAGEPLPTEAGPGDTEPREGTLVVEPAAEPVPEAPLAVENGDTLPPEGPWERHPASGGVERPWRKVPGWAWIGGAVAGVALLVGGLLLAGVIGSPPTPMSTAVGDEPVAGKPAQEPTASPVPTELPTQEPTLTAGQIARQLAEAGVTRNADWTPYIEEQNGVEMVLVPAGCFMMGSTSGYNDEKPVHEVCFKEPFWIDVYEVTNEQYGSTGCQDTSSGAEQPRNCANWTDALAHCEARGARLPTEAEWEYTARGPDGLVYPWGNEFVADSAVYWNNSGGATANVSSRPSGVSWVGAFDLSGNVWEWVDDWYDAGYYSVLPDGAINPQGPGTGDMRVLRGSSWDANDIFFLRAANRYWYDPDARYYGNGFRCALSY